MVKKESRLKPIHPGEVLRTVLEDAGHSANAVALALRVPRNRLTEIERAPVDFRGYGAGFGAILWDVAADVDEFAVEVRSRNGTRCAGTENRG